jgi:hypothetical protein
MKTGFVAMALGLTVAVAAVLVSGPAVFLQASSAHAQDSAEDWKLEFDDICSKTDDAMAFSVDELKQLVSRCEALRPRIEALGETQRKVYLKKLQSCRDLFIFVIQVKEQKQ